MAYASLLKYKSSSLFCFSRMVMWIKRGTFSRRINSQKLCNGTARTGGAIRIDRGYLLFSAICAGTFGLGVWQIQRYYWKIDVIKKAEIKFAEVDKPMLSPSRSDLSSTSACTKVVIEGKYLHENGTGNLCGSCCGIQ